MLVNIDLTRPEYTQWCQRWEEVAPGEPWPFGPYRHLATGIYETHLNFNHDIEYAIESDQPFDMIEELRQLSSNRPGDDEDFEPHRRKLQDYWDRWERQPKDYGVCDHWEQITSKWPQIVESDRKFLIFLTQMDRDSNGGFRPHKWGTYIGTNSEYGEWEHLEDHKTVDSVYVFHILEIKDEYAQQ